MSISAKKRFKSFGKIVSIIIFALVLFTNIQIASLNFDEKSTSDSSLLGIEVELFKATYGEGACNRILVIHDWLHLPACITWGGNCCPDV